jgi:hypothetical protein
MDLLRIFNDPWSKIKTSFFPNLLLELSWKSGEERECIKLIHSRSLVFLVSLAPFPQMDFTEDLAGLLSYFRDKCSWDCFWQFYIFGSDDFLRLGADVSVSIVSIRFSDNGLGTYSSVDVEGSMFFISTCRDDPALVCSSKRLKLESDRRNIKIAHL